MAIFDSAVAAEASASQPIADSLTSHVRRQSVFADTPLQDGRLTYKELTDSTLLPYARET
jgi:hypothetical protein